MSRKLITSEEFPQKHHNCPAIKVPDLIFCSGQVGKGESKRATVKYNRTTAIGNIEKVFQLSGSSLDKVVKFNIYLADMASFDTMNGAFITMCTSSRIYYSDCLEVLLTYSQALPPNPPVRTCIQAGRLPGGPDSSVEIECIAQAYG